MTHASESISPEQATLPAAMMPLWLAASLQDDLLTASNDLDRLQRLLDHACEDASRHFFGALESIQAIKQQLSAVGGVVDTATVIAQADALQGTVTALQFHDMATQLIAHTDARLRACAERLVRETMPEDEEGNAVFVDLPQRPNPVTQDELDAGSIDLF